MTDRPSSIRELDFRPRERVFPSPEDWRDQFMYQILIDRFDDARDHPPYDLKTAPRGREQQQGDVFQGGKLKGITRRLDYIKSLGCTAIWLSPPFKQRTENPNAYHGYAIQDFLEIDPRFGTTADLQELVREAHQRGLYVVLDIVINHTADVWAYEGGDGGKPFNEQGKWNFGHWRHADPNAKPNDPLGPNDGVWPAELQDPDCFSRRGSIRDMSKATGDEKVNGDFFNLKDLDLDNPKTMDVMVHAYKYWIAVADIDGYRLDTVSNIEPHMAAVFDNAIREFAWRIGKRNFMFFGELVGGDDLLRKYIGANTPAPGETEVFPHFDACLDFPLYADLDEVLKGEKSPGCLWHRYDEMGKYYRNFGEAGRYYVTFVDNHDQTHRPWRRFLHGHNDDRLAIMAAAYLLTNMGIPCWYYGTEQGFDGGGDHDRYIRECMFGGKWGAFDTTGLHFFNPDHPIYKAVGRLTEVRRQQPALRYGRQYFRGISGNGKDFGCPKEGKATLAFSRVLDTDEILIAMNLDTEPRNDWVEVDPILSCTGREMVDLTGGPSIKVEKTEGGVTAVRVPLDGRRFGIYKVGG